jgi:hypothetical protein
LWIQEASKNSNFLALIQQNVVAILFRYSENLGQGTLSNLLTGEVANLGDVSQYSNSDGSMTDVQKNALFAKSMGLLLDESLLARPSGTISNLFSPQSGGTSSWGAACTDCDTAWGAYWANTGAFLVQVYSTVRAKTWSDKGVNGGIGIFSYFTLYRQAEKSYVECLNTKCPAVLEPVPAPVNATGKVNEWIYRSITFGNKAGPRAALQWKSDSNPTLYLSELSGFLFAGETTTINLRYKCPSTPTTVNTSVIIHHDARSASPSDSLPQQVTVPVTLECLGSNYFLLEMGGRVILRNGSWGLEVYTFPLSWVGQVSDEATGRAIVFSKIKELGCVPVTNNNFPLYGIGNTAFDSYWYGWWSDQRIGSYCPN